jgi:hypothetical protein
VILWGVTIFHGILTATASAEPVAIYTNTDFRFSFSYPSSWIKRINKFEWRGDLNADLVFGIDFSDPAREKEILIADCLNNRSSNWVNATPTRATCDPILASLSADQEKKYETVMRPRNIFIRVYHSDIPLREWLLMTYKVPKTELEDYQIGRDIELSGRKGYYSSTGCCDGIDRAYAVKKEAYIYEFGTNCDDNPIIEDFVGGFKFLQ